MITIQLTIIYKGELRCESTPFCTFLQKSFRFFIQNIFWKLKNSPYWNWEMKIISRFARFYPRRMELANILSEWFRNLGNFWLGHASEPPQNLAVLVRKSVSIYLKSAPGTLIRTVKRWPWLLNINIRFVYNSFLFRDFYYWPLNRGWLLNRWPLRVNCRWEKYIPYWVELESDRTQQGI